MVHAYFSYNDRGPGKVVNNLLKGFDLCNIEYKENSDLKNVKSDDFVLCLQNHPLIDFFEHQNLIIGPNICTLPIDSEKVMSLYYKKTIVPSDWVKNLYTKWLPGNKIEIWPVGIDTDLFEDFSKEKKTNDCLLYFKRRSPADLVNVQNILKSKNQSFETIQYGFYEENEMINKAKNSKYAFIIDGAESQGIAIQELMSCNLPLFVWDIENWTDRGEQYKSSATSVPYWSEKCGEKVFIAKEIDNKFNLFLKNIDIYSPRSYILENLKLETQAKVINKFFI